MADQVNITVAICTWNRADLLDKTLGEMRKLQVPAGVSWEVIVVNNNCTDHTKQVIERHCRFLPLRMLCEEKQGHSNARNCAIGNARGELILWTDDDVLVDEHWIEEYIRAADHYPDAAFFGGTSEPWFEAKPTQWVLTNLEIGGGFGVCQLGKVVRPLAEKEFPVGANMAFRTKAMREYLFNPNLGRVKNKLISGDDTDLLSRMKHDGLLGIWVGTAVVRHLVPAVRMTKSYVWDWWAEMGALEMSQQSIHAKSLFGVPRWIVRRYLQAGFKYLCSITPQQRRGRAEAWRQLAWCSGALIASRNATRK